MQIDIITISKKLPSWLQTGFNDYYKRFPRDWKINLVELTPKKNSDETQRLLKAVKPNSHIIALDVEGQAYSTHEFARQLQHINQNNQPIALLIGSADGLSTECLQAANSRISLSKLTFPHQLVKVILIEQLYRAWSVLNHHPYHH